jgi:hypothetical protein
MGVGNYYRHLDERGKDCARQQSWGLRDACKKWELYQGARSGFGSEQASSFTASVASGSNGGSIEMRLDSIDGPKIGSLAVSSTGAWNKWQLKTTAVSGAAGVHDLYFLFRGDAAEQLFNFDYWKFNKKVTK